MSAGYSAGEPASGESSDCAANAAHIVPIE